MQSKNIGCSTSTCDINTNTIAEVLNQTCYCKTLNQDRLSDILNADNVSHDLLTTHPQLFSNIATFISRQDFEHIAESIQAIERVIALPSFREEVLSRAHANAQYNPGTAGVFMGYDFHLASDRPKLIEINTNAGGAFLNALLISAQTACCLPMQAPFLQEKQKLYRVFVDMFLNEWKLQRGDIPLKRIAIVDVEPERQFLYPEFKIAQQTFQENGIEAIIAPPEKLIYEQDQLLFEGLSIDLVYNRLTDFSLIEEASQALSQAYRAGSVVVTPNPYHHAVFANKNNLILLCDKYALQQFGVSEVDRLVLHKSVPLTCKVTSKNAANLWQRRKDLFFKPEAGSGGKATYRGDKLTKRVWKEILNRQYIAQQLVTPSERSVLLDNQPSSLKMDVRAYTYQGKIQLMAARLYQGQTTNFRTNEGGFSPIFIL